MSATERQAYDTHYNYSKCLAKLMKGATLSHMGVLGTLALPYLDTKKNLIELTKKSLNDESAIVQIDEDYSYASTSWLPIKAYYLLFNMLLTVEYIVTGDKQKFQLGHSTCVNEFTRKLKAQEIQFSEPLLNQCFDKSILSHKIATGANLSGRNSDSDMYKMVMRKIAWYKEEEWKRKNNINLKRATDKVKYARFLSSFEVSIFDFPYYMRIRSNYRDFAFIEGISTAETALYFRSYFAFIAYFSKALQGIKRDLLVKRR